MSEYTIPEELEWRKQSNRHLIYSNSPYNTFNTFNKFNKKSQDYSSKPFYSDNFNQNKYSYNNVDIRINNISSTNQYDIKISTVTEKASKHSYGVILCRLNKDNSVEILLVHKRCTFAFIDFVCGRYNKVDHKSSTKYAQFEKKFANMTTEELNYIDTLNYEMMWYKIWLNGDKESAIKMQSRKLKFEKLFSDKEKYSEEYKQDVKNFRETIRRVSKNNKLLWEIPKGKKITLSESDVICAIREMEEETCIPKSLYRIIPGAKIDVKYKDEGFEYLNTYFVAILNTDVKSTKICSSIIENPIINHETLEAGWFSIEKIRMMNYKHLERIIKPVSKIARKYMKGLTVS